MSEDDRAVDKSLQALIGGSFPATLSELTSSSLVIPANEDFHFFYNFDEFKHPIDEIAATLQCALDTVVGSPLVPEKSMRFPADIDAGGAYNWLVNANNEFLQRTNTSVDEYEMGLDSEKKKKKNEFGGSNAKVSFHIPSIKKPQDEYNIFVDNSNTPFEHILLETSEDTLQYIHPLEKLSVTDFVDTNVTDMNPVEPLPLESTPFKLVEDVNDLKDLALKLRCVEEFAVDLEHNQYRSFQGLTCLMQISTRTEDYVVDTFKLWDHIGPYLREFFKDPEKKKVMHGADRDIIWLQRDFGIYVCNLFDTGQASRVLKLERNSLEYLLKHYCGVAANKQYQNADWRIRPLPDVMTRYAREDTHYLLYIYDVMRIDLHKRAKGDEQSESPLREVYKRSYDVCMQLYKKELLNGNSYLHLYGVRSAKFNAVQLSIAAGLCEWRDVIARADDESTGYVLPNKTLLDIAKEMPINVGKLRRLLKSKNPYIERNMDAFVSVIRRSMQNAAAFESVVQSLEGWCPGTVCEKNAESAIEETCTEAVASSRSVRKFLKDESNIGDVSTTGEGKVCVDVSKKQIIGFRALPSKRKFGSDNMEKEEVKVSKPRRDEVIIILDDEDESDDDEESDEETSETDDKVSETSCKASLSMTQKPKTCDAEIIVIDDNDSDEEIEDEENSRCEKQGKYMNLKPGFLNI